jgi:uncharacterized membrane protein YcaP (DUF421 family)
MESIIRGLVVYFFLLIVFRLSGKRSLSETSSFDLVLLLIISEATQQALLGDDFSVTNAVLVITTLLLADIGLSLLKARSPRLARVLEGVPTLLVAHGRPLPGRLERARLDEEDVLAAARELQGLERMEQIRFAVLETNGQITIVPEPDAADRIAAPPPPPPQAATPPPR